MTDANLRRTRLIGWIAAISAVLLVTGYLTADEWLGLIRVLLGGAL
jgi:hypothetical protein